MEKQITKNFTDESINSILDQLEIWTLEELEDTTDHIGEIVIETLEEEGVEIPEGMFNDTFHNSIIDLKKRLDEGEITPLEGVEGIVAILTNPKSYSI